MGVHHDGVAVVSGGIDGTVYVSNIQNGRVLGALSGASVWGTLGGWGILGKAGKQSWLSFMKKA